MSRLISRLSTSPWLRLVAVLGLTALALISLVPAGHSPPRTALPGEVEHFAAYACTSAMAAFAFQLTIRVWQLTAMFIGYAAVLEYSQQWSPGRSASMLDFLSSSAGVLAGVGVCLIVLHGLARLDNAMIVGSSNDN